LRQALMEIRRALGDLAHLVDSDRDTVRLMDAVTDIETTPDEVKAALETGRDFLEGIDIADAAFEDWLREERSRLSPEVREPVPEAQSRIPLLIRLGSLPPGVGSFAGMALADSIGRLLAEFAHVDVFGAGGAAAPPDLPRGGMTLTVEGALIGDHVHMLVGLLSSETGQTIWNQRASLPLTQADFIGGGDFPPLVFQAAEAALSHVPQLGAGQAGARRASALIARALTEMFSYDAIRLRRADSMLAEALSLAPSARILAWRSLVRQIMVVERTESDTARLHAEADDFARRALEMSKANPLVLALVSQVRVMLDENPEAGTVLARDSVALSPFNAFGYAAQTGALLRAGKPAEALIAARTGAAIAARTPYVHWWESLCGLSALAQDKQEAAIAHYEAAHYRAPNFRSPMRHLLFLYLAAGDEAKARRVLKDLRRAEPDFSIDLIRNDPDYPAATLRRSRLIARYGDDLAKL
jgi:predicted Zn-dependent protease